MTIALVEPEFDVRRWGYLVSLLSMDVVRPFNELMGIVREALTQCTVLRIRKPRDVLRFLALSILITPEQKKSELLETVTRRVLGAVDDWSATKRLNFIYKHVVGRPPPNPELDFGPWFLEAPLLVPDVP